jgi:hypothetical protein
MDFEYIYNGERSPNGPSYQNLPKWKYHFYMSSAITDDYQIVRSISYITDESVFFKNLNQIFEKAKTVKLSENFIKAKDF